jgi:hypothetical protein
LKIIYLVACQCTSNYRRNITIKFLEYERVDSSSLTWGATPKIWFLRCP